MADNYLERRMNEYEIRKKEWLDKKKHSLKMNTKRIKNRPEDESL